MMTKLMTFYFSRWFCWKKTIGKIADSELTLYAVIRKPTESVHRFGEFLTFETSQSTAKYLVDRTRRTLEEDSVNRQIGKVHV